MGQHYILLMSKSRNLYTFILSFLGGISASHFLGIGSVTFPRIGHTTSQHVVNVSKSVMLLKFILLPFQAYKTLKNRSCFSSVKPLSL